MTAFLNMTEAQLSALECAGVFEGVDEELAKFVSGKQIQATDESVALVNELSNHLDSLGHGKDEPDPEKRKWYRRDAAVLSNLFTKMSKSVYGVTA